MRNIIDIILALMVLIAMVISYFFYGDSQSSSEYEDLFMHDANLDSLKTLVVEYGDLEAYSDLETGLIHQSPTFVFDILPYSLYMANKYHYIDAYYRVYLCLRNFHPSGNLDSLDTETKELALVYLKKAADNGLSGAVEELQQLTSGAKNN